MNTTPPLTLFRGANIKLDGLIHKSSDAASPHEGFEIRTPAKPSRWLGFLSNFTQFSFGIRARNEIARLQRVKLGDDASVKPVSVLTGLRSALMASLGNESTVDNLLTAARKLAGRNGSIVTQALKLHDDHRKYQLKAEIEKQWDNLGGRPWSHAFQRVRMEGPQSARALFIKAQALSLVKRNDSNIDPAAQAIATYNTVIQAETVSRFVTAGLKVDQRGLGDFLRQTLGPDIADEYGRWRKSEGLLLDALFAAGTRNGLLPSPGAIAAIAEDALSGSIQREKS